MMVVASMKYPPQSTHMRWGFSSVILILVVRCILAWRGAALKDTHTQRTGQRGQARRRPRCRGPAHPLPPCIASHPPAQRKTERGRRRRRRRRGAGWRARSGPEAGGASPHRTAPGRPGRSPAEGRSYRGTHRAVPRRARAIPAARRHRPARAARAARRRCGGELRGRHGGHRAAGEQHKGEPAPPGAAALAFPERGEGRRGGGTEGGGHTHLGAGPGTGAAGPARRGGPGGCRCGSVPIRICSALRGGCYSNLHLHLASCHRWEHTRAGRGAAGGAGRAGPGRARGWDAGPGGWRWGWRSQGARGGLGARPRGEGRGRAGAARAGSGGTARRVPGRGAGQPGRRGRPWASGSQPGGGECQRLLPSLGHFGSSQGPLSTSTRCEELVGDSSSPPPFPPSGEQNRAALPDRVHCPASGVPSPSSRSTAPASPLSPSLLSSLFFFLPLSHPQFFFSLSFLLPPFDARLKIIPRTRQERCKVLQKV